MNHIRAVGADIESCRFQTNLFIFNLLSDELQPIAEQAHSPQSCKDMSPELYLQELKDLFVVPQTPRMVNWTFQNCQQKSDQSLEDFHSQLFRLYLKLKIDDPIQFVTQFLDGLVNHEIRRKLIEEDLQ